MAIILFKIEGPYNKSKNPYLFLWTSQKHVEKGIRLHSICPFSWDIGVF